MAEKISVQIALEGGKEIARQLEAIGEAGQKAFADIASSAEKVGGFKNLNTDEVTKKLETFGITGSAAINKVTAAVKQAARLETLVQGIQSAENAMVALGRAAIVVGPAIAAAFVAASKATIAFADTINKASDQAVKLGLTLEQFTQQRKSLEALGLSTQQAGDAMAHFQQQMAQAIAQADPGSNLRLFGDAVKMTQQEMGPFIERLRQMPDGFERTALAISKLGPAGVGIIQGIRAAEGSMTSAEQKAYDLGQAIQRLQQAWADFGSVTIAPAITAQLNAITSAITGVNNLLTATSWSDWGSAGAQAALGIANSLNPIPGIIQRIIQMLARLDWSKLRGPAITGGEAGAIPGIASGGVIGGRGTGTSDSNLAWVSRGEHIMPARAVAQPGVLAFLEALRRSGGNLRHVLDGMGRFALGGLVPRPAYAGGGAVGSMSHVTIQFPGLQPIGGLRASAGTVEELRKAAALAQVRSGGRKPSRYS